MPNVFSRRTLGEFEDAAASIPLRQLDRVFQSATIRVGEDPGGPDGARRVQFRRYVASVDQHDPHQLDRLGDALGALIAEVAASKQHFLVNAAERDGFFFADGVFRSAGSVPNAFAVARAEDLSSIADHARRLHLLASDSPDEAIDGAKELLESVCRTVLRLIGEPPPETRANLMGIATSTLTHIEPTRHGSDDGKKAFAIVRKCLEQLGAVVVALDELRDVSASLHGRDDTRNGPLTRQARLAVGAAVTFAGFVAETYVERNALNTVDGP